MRRTRDHYRRVLEMRRAGRKLHEIADVFNVTTERARQMEAKALRLEREIYGRGEPAYQWTVKAA